jgi:hypothetical protein
MVDRFGTLCMSTLAQTDASKTASVELCFQPNCREAGESHAVLRHRGLVKRITPIRIVSFFLWATCGALSQSVSLSPVSPQGVHSYRPPDAQRQELHPQTSLPYAPSVQPQNQPERLPAFIDELILPLPPGAFGLNMDAMRETGLGQVSHRSRPTFTVPYKAMFTQKEPVSFLDKYLDRPLSQNPRYHPSTSLSFMGRATDAASRIFVTRNATGSKRLNTSYLFGVLGSIAIHSARSPSWTRTASAPFNDLGSTIGNDAGVNLFHEFGPGIRQMVKGHAPKFVSRIAEGLTRGRNPREAISTPAR